MATDNTLLLEKLPKQLTLQLSVKVKFCYVGRAEILNVITRNWIRICINENEHLQEVNVMLGLFHRSFTINTQSVIYFYCTW